MWPVPQGIGHTRVQTLNGQSQSPSRRTIVAKNASIRHPEEAEVAMCASSHTRGAAAGIVHMQMSIQASRQWRNTMLKIRIAITAVTAGMIALCAATANAHEYYRANGAISQTNQWDVSKAAPFSRDENDRFTP
jgi:hypothetical protein